MFKELFRFEGESRDLEAIKRGIREATGDPDFLGFEEASDPEKKLEKNIKEGFIEFKDGYTIVNADIN